MITDYIDYIKSNNITKESALQLLKDDETLSPQRKNLIFAYCFPRQLLDREFPTRLKQYRDKSGYSGLNLDPSEVILIVEAGQTEQYKRYIKHLMYSFGDPHKISPVKSTEETNPRCGICDCELLYYDSWNSYAPGVQGEIERKEFLALGSTETSIILCKHCLLQLVSAIDIMNSIDPSYLDWTKRK